MLKVLLEEIQNTVKDITDRLKDLYKMKWKKTGVVMNKRIEMLKC